jgi:hypothetical protein
MTYAAIGTPRPGRTVDPTSTDRSGIMKLGTFLGRALEFLGVAFEFTIRAFFGVMVFGIVHYVMSLPQ